jgi:hypothetical protein
MYVCVCVCERLRKATDVETWTVLSEFYL